MGLITLGWRADRRDGALSALPAALLTGAALMGAAAALGGCGPDGRQVRLCAQAFKEIEDGGAGYVRVGAEALPETTPGVALLYRARDAAAATPRRFVCRFRGARFAPGQSALVGITRMSGRPLSELALQHLRLRVGLR
jgi:hypothetical protein